MAIDYTLNWSDDNLKPPFILSGGKTDIVATSLALTGKGTINWGERLQENLIRLLENFASNNVAPSNATLGQEWFNASTKRLNVLNASGWKELAYRRIEGPAAPEGPNYPGDLWYDTTTDLLKVYTNAGNWAWFGHGSGSPTGGGVGGGNEPTTTYNPSITGVSSTSTSIHAGIVSGPPSTVVLCTVVNSATGVAAAAPFNINLDSAGAGVMDLAGLTTGVQYLVTFGFSSLYTYTNGSQRATVITTAGGSTGFTSYVPSLSPFVGAINVTRAQVVGSKSTDHDGQLANGSYYVFSAIAAGTSLPAVLTGYVNYLNNTLGQIHVKLNATERWNDAGTTMLSTTGIGLANAKAAPGTVIDLYVDNNITVYPGYSFNYRLAVSWTAADGFTFIHAFKVGGGSTNVYLNTVPTNAISIYGVVQYMKSNTSVSAMPTIEQYAFN